MPRFEAVSSTSTEWRIRRSPSPCTDARILRSCPAVLRICVTLILPLIVRFLGDSRPSGQDLLDGLATLRGDVLGRGDVRERVEGGAHHVDGIARAVALGEHVAN